MATPDTQQQYRLLIRNGAAHELTRVSAPVRPPGERDVLVAVKATSLNYRDKIIAAGRYPLGAASSVVPLSDGAGEIIAVGARATRFRVGDRVASTFFADWSDGRPRPTTAASALGGGVDGMLSQFVTAHEDGFVKLPAHLAFEEGATLTCAGVTAWNGLMKQGRMQAGDHVLLQGTGGVSIFGLQFAAAAGAKPIITSSSDEKLQRAKSLGAFATINYRSSPEWSTAVLAATGGQGVEQILEVGGEGTLGESLKSVALGGHIAIIGGLSGFGGAIPPRALMTRSARVSGIFVGSRAMFEEMNAFVERHRIKPVVDRVFGFDEAAAAFAYMDSGSLFGKVVIRV